MQFPGVPSPIYPELHVHVKLPAGMVPSVHMALVSQGPGRAPAHSSISEMTTGYFLCSFFRLAISITV